MKILVSSFDERSFAWPPFVHGFKKYWPDCPWEVKFLTNKLDSPLGEAIKVPESTDWVYMMKRALEQIEDETILFTIEDYWITHPVATGWLYFFYNLIEAGLADYIKLMPSPDATLSFYDVSYLNEFKKDALYRTSLNMSIWNKDLLYNLLEDGENIWQFETQAGKRVPDKTKMLAVTEKKYMRIVEGEDGWPSSSAVEQGKLTEAGKLYIQKEGL